MHFGILWGVDASIWGQCDMVKIVVKWAYSGFSIMHALREKKKLGIWIHMGGALKARDMRNL
jgi:hypothetical protein